MGPADQFVNGLCRVDLRNAARRDEIEEPGLVASLPSHLVVKKFLKCLLMDLRLLQLQNICLAFWARSRNYYFAFRPEFNKDIINKEGLN